MYIMYNVLVDAAYYSVALAANLDWSRLCKQTQHSGSAEGTQARGHCAHFVTMCASGKNRILVACIETCCAEQALCEARPRGTAFSGNYCWLTPWPCKTGASTCASHCTSNSLRSPPAGQAPVLYLWTVRSVKDVIGERRVCHVFVLLVGWLNSSSFFFTCGEQEAGEICERWQRLKEGERREK